MLKKKITYTDYNGVERTETFYFNLNEAEMVEMEFGTTGGIAAFCQKIIDSKDIVSIMEMFKKIIFKAYGEKSDDGKRLVKSYELSKAFSETEAYNILMIEILSGEDGGAAADFIKGIIPDKIKAEIEKKDVLSLKAS